MSNRLCSLGLMLFLFALPALADENPMLVRVDLVAKTDLETLAELHFDIPYVADGFADVVVYPYELSRLTEVGLHYQIVHQDLVKFYQSRNPLGVTMGGFLTFPEILDTIDALHTNFSNYISARDSIGHTWEGRGMWVFKVSDNVDIDEDEPEVFFNALIHAREPAGWSWQLHFILWLMNNYGTDSVATEIVNERELYFLPVFNPDGYEYNRQTDPNGGGMWRKNRRSGGGVDLNRNWGYMWGYDNDGSSPNPYDETYRGPSAFSEPETQAVRDFIISRNFNFIVNGHTYGDHFLYPWGYADIYTPDQSTFATIGDSVATLINYDFGTPWELLYNTNGESCDWQYGEQIAKPLIFCAVTETGSWSDGFWPAQYRIPQINAQLLPFAKYISLLAGGIRSIAPPAAPVLATIGEIHTDTFTVSWTHQDEYNPAVAFELIEKTGLSRVADDLESGSGNWQLDGFLLRTNRYHSATHSLFSGSQDNYNGHATMDESFVVVPGDTLNFYTWYDIESNWDYAYVELSTNGGQTFVTVPGNITTNYNPNGNNRGNGITGSSNNIWVLAKFPLNVYIDSSVTVRYTYSTDGAVLNAGFYVDDIFPLEAFSQEIIISSDITGNSYLVEGRTDGTYYYQVRAKDAEDQWSGFSNREEAAVLLVSIGEHVSVPSDFALQQNYPNPFNPRTEIRFSLASPGAVKLEIYDVAGKLVRILVDGTLPAGNHQADWDGKNQGGHDVSSGVYLYKLSSAEYSLARKMTLVR